MEPAYSLLLIDGYCQKQRFLGLQFGIWVAADGKLLWQRTFLVKIQTAKHTGRRLPVAEPGVGAPHYSTFVRHETMSVTSHPTSLPCRIPHHHGLVPSILGHNS